MLGKVLIDKGVVSQNDLSRALAAQIEVSFIKIITEQMADIDLLKKVPLKFLKYHTVIPIVFEDQRTIITSNPY